MQAVVREGLSRLFYTLIIIAPAILCFVLAAIPSWSGFLHFALKVVRRAADGSRFFDFVPKSVFGYLM